MLTSILYGAITGAGRSLYSFSKLEKTDFDWGKFFKTVIIGGVVGGIAAGAGMSFEVATTSMEALGLLTVVDVGATAVANAVAKKLYGAIQWLGGY